MFLFINVFLCFKLILNPSPKGEGGQTIDSFSNCVLTLQQMYDVEELMSGLSLLYRSFSFWRRMEDEVYLIL